MFTFDNYDFAYQKKKINLTFLFPSPLLPGFCLCPCGVTLDLTVPAVSL